MNSRFLKPGHRVWTYSTESAVHRVPVIAQVERYETAEVREVRYAYPAGNAGIARTFIEFTDGTSGEFPTGAFWIVED